MLFFCAPSPTRTDMACLVGCTAPAIDGPICSPVHASGRLAVMHCSPQQTRHWSLVVLRASDPRLVMLPRQPECGPWGAAARCFMDVVCPLCMYLGPDSKEGSPIAEQCR